MTGGYPEESKRPRSEMGRGRSRARGARDVRSAPDVAGGRPGRISVPFLVHGLQDASVRYRLGQFVAPLRELGVDLRLHEIPRAAPERLALFRRLRGAPLVGIQRKLFSLPYLYLLRRLVGRILFDFDDALYLRDSRDDSRRSRTREFRFGHTLRVSSTVIAGNRVLLEQARRHTRHVHLLPTSIDLERYQPGKRSRRRRAGITIGWIGSRSTLFYLEDLGAALEELGRQEPGARLKVIADRFPRLRDIEVIRKPWREAEEVEDLREVDVGIMPLREDAWSAGKCGLKLLQYMAMGIPVVCTPVGTNLDLVCDGVEGLHARTREEWVAALRRLSADPALRARLGRRGRERVRHGYAAADTATALGQILRAAHPAARAATTPSPRG